MTDSDGYKISPGELKKLLEEAAEAGASKVLKELGLEDPKDREDLKDALGLARAWRDARSTVARAVLTAVTYAMLGALIVGAAFGIGKQIP